MDEQRQELLKMANTKYMGGFVRDIRFDVNRQKWVIFYNNPFGMDEIVMGNYAQAIDYLKVQP